MCFHTTKIQRIFEIKKGVIIFVVRTGIEPVLLVITLFTNHPYLGPSTIPPPDYFVITLSNMLIQSSMT